MILSDFHCDAITESMNIGIGTSADILSQLVDRPIRLSIPRVRFVQLETLRKYLDNNYQNWGSCVILPFMGGLKGDGVLVFSPDSARSIVELVSEIQIGGTVMAEIEDDLLMEVGNIIINGCVGSLVNLLELESTDGLPRFCSRGGAEVLDELLEQDKADTFGMIITTSLQLEGMEKADIRTDLIITFDNSCMPVVLDGFTKLVT